MSNKKKVLLIGWDAADWKVINPLIDAGKMPTLEKMINNGVMGNLATLDPPLSPMLWTSIATGMTADKHGVLGFAEPDTDKMSVRPVNVTSRKVKALWNILQHEGLKSNVVGWWPSHPAEPIDGCYVSNFFHKAGSEYGKEWKIPKKSVHPPELIDEIHDLRIHQGEITGQHILPFVPNADKVDQSKDNKLTGLAKIISETASIQASATYLMENKDWDLTAVYFDGIDHFCHGFMKFHPPRLPHIPEDFYEMYKDVINGAYIFHDMMLERMLQLAGDDTLVFLVSDHGFHSDHLRLPALPDLPAAPAMEHNPLGVICAYGPGIKKDDRVFGATLLDITPTILAALDIPLGKDMDGKPLLNIFEEQKELKYIDSWEEVEGECGMHPPHAIEDAYASAEALEQLVELGYIDDPGEDSKAAMDKASNEAKFNLSRVYASKREYGKALELSEELYASDPEDIRYRMDLLRYYIELLKLPEARNIVDELRESESRNMPALDMLEGILLYHEEKPDESLESLKKAEASNPRLPVLHCEIGKVYIKLQQYEDAAGAFSKALEIDENNAVAFHGLSVCMLRTGKYDEAVDYALSSIGITFHFPSAHYHLGEALYNIKKYKEASQAFEMTLRMAPSLKRARQWLVNIYTDHLPDPEKAEEHRQLLDPTQDDIVIVSGLPRSGTSMMMQILEAGGVEIYTDKKRTADENNPKGYYEYEKVKALGKDNSWIPEVKGKAIKVIAQLLQNLPEGQKYKVIFMQREMQEVLQSQMKMLGKSTDTLPLAVIKAFEKELEKVRVWAEKEPGVEIYYVNYSEIIENPEKEIGMICDFLGRTMNEEEMFAVVDPDLYRNRHK